MENLGLSVSENSIELVPQPGTVGRDSLTEMTLPISTHFRAVGVSQTDELLFTQPLNQIDLSQAREADLGLPDQDLDFAASTVGGTLPVAIDPLTGQTIGQATFDQAVQATYHSLTSFTQDDFTAKSALAFGSHFNPKALEDFRQQWEAGNFEGLPTIELRSNEELEGAQAAFSIDTDTVYLSQAYLRQNASNSQAIASVLLEEIGHYVDSRINSSDADGDEGAIFSALAQGVQLSQPTLQALKVEDDTATITLDGQVLQVEQATGYTIKDTNYSVPSRAYFVSPGGRDSNRGTQASPWRTIEKAINSAPGGSTVVLRGGTYREGNLIVGKKLTFQPYPHEKVWIKGSLNIEDWDRDGALWRKDNWNHWFENITDPRKVDRAHPLAGRLDMVFINGGSLTQVASKAQVGSGEFYVDHSSKRLYIGSNPGGKTVEATAFEHGVRFNQPSSHSVVRGLGFAHYAENAIEVNAPRAVLDKNTVVWNGWEGSIINEEDAVVRGNTFSRNGARGLFLSSSHRTLVEKNTFSYNNIERFRVQWGGAGIKFATSNSVILRNNIVEHNYSNGLWGDMYSHDSTIVGNIARHNQHSSIYSELSQRAIIASNLSVYNGSGITLLDSANARIWNNTLSKNAVNIVVKDGERNPWAVTNNIIMNNILSGVAGRPSNGDIPLLISATKFVDIPSTNQMVTGMDYNAYYRPSSNSPSNVIRMSLPQRGNKATTYETVAGFTSATRFEDHALAIRNVVVNPFFVSEGSGNYRLKPGSIAIGRGRSLPDDIARAVGVRAGVGVNLGALRLPNW